MNQRITHSLFAILLAILMASLYFMTYSARLDSGDELRIFDGASSWARYGDWGRDESLWLGLPDYLLVENPYPIEFLQDDEQAMASLVSWFYRLADAVPAVGLVHVAWLTNLVVMILCVVVFFFFARILGYDIRVAIISAILLGIGTLVWAYSKTLFREPTVMLFLLISALSATYARKTPYFGKILAYALAIVFGLFAIQIKTSAVFALPAIVLFAVPFPARFNRQNVRKIFDFLLVLTLIFIICFAYLQPFVAFFTQIFSPILSRLSATQDYTQIAVHTYLFSVGGSFWGTSPILLLGILGVYQLIRHGERRVVWAVLSMIVAYSFGHAFLTGEHWFGGLSFPSRFILPVVPFAMLWVLPAIDYLLQKRRLWLLGLTIGLLLYSVWVQFVAVASYWQSYAEFLLPEQAQKLAEWSDGLNRLEFLRWVLYPQGWGRIGLDFAWRRANLPEWAFANGVLVCLISILLCFLLIKPRATKYAVLSVVVGIGALGVVNLLGLRALNQNDNDYQAQNTSLHQAFEFLQHESRDNEVLLLPDRTFDDFVMNYNRVTHIRPLILPNQPGERVSGEVTAQVVSNSTSDLLTWFSMRAIDHLPIYHEHLWLLTNTSVYLPWAVRPVERYLAENYYLIREMPLNNPEVRLLQFDLTPYPYRFAFANPEYLTDLQYGDDIELVGFTLPKGINYQAGESLPIALEWRTSEVLQDDMVISWFLAPKNAETPVIQGMDTQPHAGFAPTTTWRIADSVQDRRAMLLPNDLPQGEYEIWVLLYRFVNGNPERLSVTGAKTLPNNIGVLPVTLLIESDSP